MTASLKIWDGGSGDILPPSADFRDSDLPERARLTVRQYYEAVLKDSRMRLSSGQRKLDQTTLNRWEQFGGAWDGEWSFCERFRRWSVEYSLDSSGDRIWLPDPPIGRITDESLELFVRSLRDAGRAVDTVAQSVRILDYIFGQAAPRDSMSNRGRDDLLRRPVFPEKWERDRSMQFEDEREPVFLNSDNVSALYRGASDVHRVTQRLPTRPIAALGKAMIVFQANYGLRPSDLLRLQWGRNIDAEATTLKYRPKKTPEKKIVLPINPVTQQHLLSSRKRGTPEVFYPSRSERLLGKHWKRIVEASGIPIVWKTDCLGRKYLEPSLYAMRSYCATTLDGVCPGAGSYVVGHAVKSIKRVTAQHYHNRNEIPPYVRDALWSVPQPSAFSGSSGAG